MKNFSLQKNTIKEIFDYCQNKNFITLTKKQIKYLLADFGTELLAIAYPKNYSNKRRSYKWQEKQNNIASIIRQIAINDCIKFNFLDKKMQYKIVNILLFY